MDIDRELEEVNFIECEITLLEERVKCLLRQILDLEHELKVPWRNCSGVLDFREEGYIVVGGMPLMPLLLSEPPAPDTPLPPSSSSTVLITVSLLKLITLMCFSKFSCSV